MTRVLSSTTVINDIHPNPNCRKLCSDTFHILCWFLQSRDSEIQLSWWSDNGCACFWWHFFTLDGIQWISFAIGNDHILENHHLSCKYWIRTPPKAQYLGFSFNILIQPFLQVSLYRHVCCYETRMLHPRETCKYHLPLFTISTQLCFHL